jgi:hypothetical protein
VIARLGLAIALLVGCAKKHDDAPPPPPGDRPPPLSETEVKRSRDACATLVDLACACAQTVPAAKDACEKSRALPEAVRIALEVAANPDTARQDVISSQASVRKTVKSCIEETAKLPSIGCK